MKTLQKINDASADNSEMCSSCSGSGEGMHGGIGGRGRCSACGGTGEARGASDEWTALDDYWLDQMRGK